MTLIPKYEQIIPHRNWGSHSGGYKDISLFWDITPCSPFKSQPTFRRNMSPPSYFTSCLFHASFLLSSTLKLEATCFPETSMDFQRTTRRYIPEYQNCLNRAQILNSKTLYTYQNGSQGAKCMTDTRQLGLQDTEPTGRRRKRNYWYG
jgi:hypothetical protein